MRPRAQKFGRNDPCPCGSGKKYKRCCLDSPNTRRAPEHSLPPPEIIRSFLDHQRREKERKEKFGEVKPEIAIDFKGYKFVAVGSTLHYSKKWKFFADFLQEYVPTVFGKEWGEAELAKPVEQRHPLVQWRTKCLQFLQRQTPDAEGVYAVIPNGFAAARP
ncbi:MAG: SEC-C metal-binding domain-containing protein, partial [Candidatus Acidiferrales bacterium]